MFTKKEKEVMKAIIKYHLKEVKEDNKVASKELVAVLGAEARYEKVLKEMLKKL